MDFAVWMMFEAVVLVPLAMGLMIYLRLETRTSSVVRWSLGLAGTATSLVIVLVGVAVLLVSVIDPCQASRRLRQQAQTLMTPEEFRTLHGSDLFCSTVYTFRRNGKKECLIDVSGHATLGCG